MQTARQLDSYRDVQKKVLSGRELEAMVLNKAALKLQLCRDNWDAHDREDKLDEALRYNQQVWTVLQGELSKPENPLLEKLKLDLLSLSVFVDKRIFEVMSFPAPEKIDILININRNIAAGLTSSK